MRKITKRRAVRKARRNPWLRRALFVLIAALVAVSVAGAPAAGRPEQTPKRGGTLVVGRPAFAEPACLNPLTCAVSGDPALAQVLEGAFEVGPDLVPRPDLVSHVITGTQSAQPDLLHPPRGTLERRRPGHRPRFPVHARGLRRPTTKTSLGSTPTCDVRGSSMRRRSGSSCAARSPRGATFTRSFFRVMHSWVRTSPRSGRTVWTTRGPGEPIGSGPFLVTRLERGKQITLVRNPRYWGPHLAYLDRLVHRFMTPDPLDPLAAVRESGVGLGFNLGGGGPMSSDDAREIRELPGWRTAAWPGNAMEHYVFRVGSGGHPALKSKLVRQALAFGIDRVAIARDIQGDAPASIRRPMDSTVFLPTEPSYRPNWSQYRYDVARSRRLLERAGCRRGPDGIYECAGERLRLRFVTSADAPERERILELAAAQLREVGVDVDLRYAPSTVFLTQILPGGDFDAALFSWSGVAGGVAVWPEALCGDRAELRWLLQSTGSTRRRAERHRKHGCASSSPQPPRLQARQGGARSAGRSAGRPRLFSQQRSWGSSRRIHLRGSGGLGGLVARTTSASGGGRRLAPRRLGSGRRGDAADAEARRHARLSPARPRACLSERSAR